MESIKTYTTLTKDRLIELEQKEKSSLELLLDFFITIGPLLACALAILEYLLLPNARENDFVHRYVVLLLVPAAIYAIKLIIALVRYRAGDKKHYWKLRYKAPLYSAVYIFLLIFDVLTLKVANPKLE